MLFWNLTPYSLTLSGTNFHFVSLAGMVPDIVLDSNQCPTLPKIIKVKMQVFLRSIETNTGSHFSIKKFLEDPSIGHVAAALVVRSAEEAVVVRCKD